MQRKPRGVLFDSADVLVRPVDGTTAEAPEAWRRWFPGPRFQELVRAYLPGLNLGNLDRAIEVGMEYLDERHQQPIVTVDQERELFQVFYEIVLESLGARDPRPELTAALARALVDDLTMEPFPEVPAVLERLQALGLRLGVLAEGWPSLSVQYERMGLRRFFDAFVISAEEARPKDDPLLFAVARERMRLPAQEILFVDDWPPHVQTAVKLGFQGAVVVHDLPPPSTNLPLLPDLRAVEAMAGR
ncbi:MAG TPA: HAD-IA family hydrolase [Actinomycetes bacterium]|jgi:HAD superfamily hydrolase (TIGR01509 family)|nr:HAD-IA family hydrolase [Actinomycetes bacterium]